MNRDSGSGLAMVVDHIVSVETHRRQRAVYVRIAVPPGVDRDHVAATLQHHLEPRGSVPEIEVVTAEVERVRLRTLEFELEEAG